MFPNNDDLSNNGDLSEDYDNLSAKSKAEGNGTTAFITRPPSPEVDPKSLERALDELVKKGELLPAQALISPNGNAIDIVPCSQLESGDRSICNAWISTRLPADFLASSEEILEEETEVKTNDDEPATSPKPPRKTL